MKHPSLENLARLYGVNATYVDVWGKRRATSTEALVRALQLLGAGIHGPDDAPEALRRRRQECWREMLEPVYVAWQGLPAAVPVRLPDERSCDRWCWRLEFEEGDSVEASGHAESLPVRQCREVEGVGYSVRLLDLPRDLPCGYHRLVFEIGEGRAEALVIVAPRGVYSGTPTERQRLWGVFLPLYALHRESSWGAGDFSDLEALIEWTAAQGGSLVATLPLLRHALGADRRPQPLPSRHPALLERVLSRSAADPRIRVLRCRARSGGNSRRADAVRRAAARSFDRLSGPDAFQAAGARSALGRLLRRSLGADARR